MNTIRHTLTTIFNMKAIAFVLFSLLLIASSFDLYHAKLTNDTLGLALMILLLSLFTELKTFSFWGLTGEKYERDLKALTGKKGVDKQAVPKPSTRAVVHATSVVEDPVRSVGESMTSRFLTLSYDIERLVRVAATLMTGQKGAHASLESGEMISVLRTKGLLTDDGVRQVAAIRDLRNIIVDGRESDITPATMEGGVALATELHNGLTSWLTSSK